MATRKCMRAALGRVEDRLLVLEELCEVVQPEGSFQQLDRVRSLAFVVDSLLQGLRGELDAAMALYGGAK